MRYAWICENSILFPATVGDSILSINHVPRFMSSCPISYICIFCWRCIPRRSISQLLRFDRKLRRLRHKVLLLSAIWIIEMGSNDFEMVRGAAVILLRALWTVLSIYYIYWYRIVCYWYNSTIMDEQDNTYHSTLVLKIFIHEYEYEERGLVAQISMRGMHAERTACWFAFSVRMVAEGSSFVYRPDCLILTVTVNCYHTNR